MKNKKCVRVLGIKMFNEALYMSSKSLDTPTHSTIGVWLNKGLDTQLIKQV